MPQVKLPILSSVPFEEAALIISYVAYPGEHEERERTIYAVSLCRAAHTSKCRTDKNWINSVQLIKPYLLCIDDKSVIKSLRKGGLLFNRRVTTAGVLLHPHLYSYHAKKPPPAICGFYPTVANISQILMDHFGWKGDSEATFKSKIWGTTKPVAHLAHAICYSFFIPQHERTSRITGGEKDGIDLNLLELLNASGEALLAILITAELTRRTLPKLKQFRFKEEDLIEFEPSDQDLELIELK
jgi:hypothetical protein